jgi:hypothetical protein
MEFRGTKAQPKPSISKAWYFHRKQAISRPKTIDDPALPGPYDAFQKNNQGETR